MCTPDKDGGVKYEAENLGEVLGGDEIASSPYSFKVKVDEYCKFLCRKVYNEDEAETLREYIDDQYRAHLIIDNLPLATVVEVISSQSTEPSLKYDLGYDLGYVITGNDGTIVDTNEDHDHDHEDMRHFINNHLSFYVKVNLLQNEAGESVHRIVGFEVQPWSVNHKYDGEFNVASPSLTTCATKIQSDALAQSVDAPGEVIFTYDVVWKESVIKWGNRWDLYFESGSDKIHWFSIVNSLMIVLFLSAIVAIILLRAINQDIAR